MGSKVARVAHSAVLREDALPALPGSSEKANYSLEGLPK